MMLLYCVFFCIVFNQCNTLSSPIQPLKIYKNWIEFEPLIADLWWTVDDDEKEITFELHVKTNGWIGFGISPAGGMQGADIAIGWVDSNGQLVLQDRYAVSSSRPTIDSTTNDWFGIQGRESDGWTAIQFRRLLDTCDTMDVPIRSGTNILILAFGLTDPTNDISYHQQRRYTRMIPLRSYANPPSEDVFEGLQTIDFKLNQYLVPNTDTTYHCKVYKGPTNIMAKKHIIAYKTIVQSENRDLVHHFTTYECDLSVRFDDENLPDGVCDDLVDELKQCVTNVIAAWAIGGDDIVEFPKEAGLPIGLDRIPRYYMTQMHYDNPKRMNNRFDSSGIRFYIGRDLRLHDLGYLQFGVDSTPAGLAIPPKMNSFMVDSYCSPIATKHWPISGITVVAALPHTHLQGRSVWTKIVRNNTVVQYLFNADAYDFNYQFQNRLPKHIQLYPGDAFLTRCIFSTLNKDTITLGGEKTSEEMCSHTFLYYPRVPNLIACISRNDRSAWQSIIDEISCEADPDKLKSWLLTLDWTQELSRRWQEYYNNASRLIYMIGLESMDEEKIERIPNHRDLTNDGSFSLCSNNIPKTLK